MSKVSFALQYEGAAVEKGLMSVRELAPALLAFGDLCDQANREVNGDRAKIDVKIKTFARGSFIVELIVGVTVFSCIVSGVAKPASQVLDVVKKAIEVTKALKGEKIERATKISDEVTQLTINHNHVIDVSPAVYELMKNPPAQRDMMQIVSPLKSEGIDRLRSRRFPG